MGGALGSLAYCVVSRTCGSFGNSPKTGMYIGSGLSHAPIMFYDAKLVVILCRVFGDDLQKQNALELC